MDYIKKRAANGRPYNETVEFVIYRQSKHGSFLPCFAGSRGILLLAEGLAVGALFLGGIDLVGTYQDPVQGAVVLTVAVIGALLDSTFNRLVCVAVHHDILLFLWVQR